MAVDTLNDKNRHALRNFLTSEHGAALLLWLRLNAPETSGVNEGEMLKAALRWNGWQECVNKLQTLREGKAPPPTEEGAIEQLEWEQPR